MSSKGAGWLSWATLEVERGRRTGFVHVGSLYLISCWENPVSPLARMLEAKSLGAIQSEIPFGIGMPNVALA